MSGQDIIARLRAVNPQLRDQTLISTTMADGTVRVVFGESGYVITVTPAMQTGIERIEAFTAALNRATASMARVVARLEQERGRYERT